MRSIAGPLPALMTATLTLLVLLTGCDAGEKPGTTAKNADPDSTPNEMMRKLDKGFAIPQEELAKKKGMVKITGTLEIEGYTEGRIQLDVSRVAEGPQRPVTTARFDKPGPFKLLLPPNIGEVELMGILDFASDGPNREDPRSPYPDNPITIGTEDIAGITLRINMDEIQATPPQNQPPQPNEGQGPPGEGGQDINTEDSSEILLRPDGLPETKQAQ